ncbi:MAG: aminoglycoside phosphotransferase family protein [Pirellulales bacterium]
MRELCQTARGDLGFSTVPAVRVTNVQDAPRSYTAKLVLTSSQNRSEVLLKIVRRGATPADAQSLAAKEFRILQSAHDRFAAEQRISVPKPIRLFEDCAAYAMKFVSGRPLTRAFSHTLRGFLSSRRFIACVVAARDCGRWLSVFHSLPTAPASAQELFQRQISSLHARLDHARTRQLLDDRTIVRLRQRFSIENRDAPDQPVGLAHHDFGPHNILITPAGICVLDLGDAQPQCILHDVARFCLEIDILASGWSLFDRRGQYEQLRDAFLSSYGVSLNDSRLELFTANGALALMLTALPNGKSSPGVSSWHRHLGRYLIQRLTIAA